MGTFANIQAALDTKLNGVSGLPAIAWTATAYTPVVGTPWLRATNMPMTALLATQAGLQKHSGIYQVDIFYPIGKGLGVALGYADSIKTAFTATRDLTAGSDHIWIYQVGIGKGERQEAWDHIYVEVFYKCYS